MEHITVQEAAKKWGVSIRRVQYLCNHGMIPGAVRFGKVWTIPKESEKPKDGRCKIKEDKQNNIEFLFQSLHEKEELLSNLVELFPYPIQVYTPDGTMVLTNEAFLKLFKVESKEKVIGTYNVLQDPVIEAWGLKEFVKKGHKGEIVQLYDIKAPIPEIIEQFGKRELGYDSLFQNIISYPIWDADNKLHYIVTLFITARLYQDKEEIIKAKEYIEIYWREDFDIDKIAGSVNLSRYHFARMFKKYTSMTPYSYYQEIKVKKLQMALCDKSISIAEAFASCGVNYNGSYPRIFKEKTGLTPSQYRKMYVYK